MVFTRILGRVGRVFGCLRRKRKNLRDSLKSRDRDVAANETLSDSDSLSVYSVYLVDSVSEVSEDGQSVAFDDCWSYSESVELSLNTEESSIGPACTVTDCMDSVFLSADSGNVSYDLEEEQEFYGLYKGSGGRILFAI